MKRICYVTAILLYIISFFIKDDMWEAFWITGSIFLAVYIILDRIDKLETNLKK